MLELLKKKNITKKEFMSKCQDKLEDVLMGNKPNKEDLYRFYKRIFKVLEMSDENNWKKNIKKTFDYWKN